MLCARCVRCDVSSARMALFTFCVVCCDSAKSHIFGSCAPRRGAITPKFELGWDFCAMRLPQSFIILCLVVRKLMCWQTHPQTHTQTNSFCQKHPTFFATLRRWVNITKFFFHGFACALLQDCTYGDVKCSVATVWSVSIAGVLLKWLWKQGSVATDLWRSPLCNYS